MSNQYEVLGKAPTADDLKKLSPDEIHLTIKGLNAGYGKMEILHNFDLFVNKAQSLCLIGPNGAGKSTILHSIYGFTNIFSGQIEIEGKEITNLSPAEKLKSVGIAYILQDNSVFPDMTVEENLLMGGYIKDKTEESYAEAKRVLEKYERLNKRRNQPAKVLSGGERRLLEISRALVMRPSILLVDDEPDILEIIRFNLEKEGYQIKMASDGLAALREAKFFSPHLIILDVMMPELDGIETCHRLRQDDRFQETIIMFLTARGEDYSYVAAFEAGADDYVTKPVKPKVLVSKVKGLLRRLKKKETISSILEFKNLIINRDSYLIILNGREILLPRKEFELLHLLASKPNKVFNREKIMDEIWGDNIVVGDRTIDVHIRKLREKIGDHRISTVKGIGYKYVP